MAAPSMQIDKGNAPAPVAEIMASARLARVLWDAVFGKGAWDNAERCNAHRELRIRWIAAITPFCKAPAETGAQVNRQRLMDAWEAGWDAINRGVGAFDPAKYADSINLAPGRALLPYSAEEIADDILLANGVNPKHYPAVRAHTIAAAKRFCVPSTPASLGAPLLAQDLRFGSGKWHAPSTEAVK